MLLEIIIASTREARVGGHVGHWFERMARAHGKFEIELIDLCHLKLPLFVIIGVRSYHAHQKGQSRDSCPVFTEPILQAWQILPHVV